MIRTCKLCDGEYDDRLRRNKPGLITVCQECAEESEDTVPYTGNVIYDHKVGPEVQINTDPALTAYISNATKLRNKASNLGNNAKVDGPRKSEGACIRTISGKSNAKGRM